MFDPLTLSSAAATALGAWNIGRWFVTTAAEKRRKAKAAIALKNDVKAAIKFAKNAYIHLSDGIDADEAAKIKAIAAAIKNQLKSEAPANAPKPTA